MPEARGVGTANWPRTQQQSIGWMRTGVPTDHRMRCAMPGELLIHHFVSSRAPFSVFASFHDWKANKKVVFQYQHQWLRIHEWVCLFQLFSSELCALARDPLWEKNPIKFKGCND
jgi:hypothetical protein